MVNSKKEHQKECERETLGRHTQAIKEQAQQENLISAKSDHCKGKKHIMDWEKVKVILSESNKHHHWIREATEIQI